MGYSSKTMNEEFWNPSILYYIYLDMTSSNLSDILQLSHGLCISLSSHGNLNAITRFSNIKKKLCSHFDFILRWLHDSCADIKMSVRFSSPARSTRNLAGALRFLAPHFVTLSSHLNNPTSTIYQSGCHSLPGVSEPVACPITPHYTNYLLQIIIYIYIPKLSVI